MLQCAGQRGTTFSRTHFTLVLTPMMFLSGVFPREQLPPLVRAISDWLPLTNAAELVRPCSWMQWPQPLRRRCAGSHHGGGLLWLALALTRRRFRG